MEVDAKIVAYDLSYTDDLDRALAALGPPPANIDRQQWRYGTLYGLLWPRGAELRSHALQAYNPFNPLPKTDRWLVLQALPPTTQEIRLETEDWHTQLNAALVRDGAASLSAPLEQRRDLRSAILRMLTLPLDTERLLVQPVVSALVPSAEAGEGRRLLARFDIREGIQ